jgi:hypothetical protein
VKRDKHSTTISYDAKALRLSRRRAKEKTEAFREAYRFRAGVEGTMSDLARVTGIKHLRVRGMRPVRVAAVLKAAGLNILRASAFRTGKKQSRRRKSGSSSHDGIILRLADRLDLDGGAFLWSIVRAHGTPLKYQLYWLKPSILYIQKCFITTAKSKKRRSPLVYKGLRRFIEYQVFIKSLDCWLTR